MVHSRPGLDNFLLYASQMKKHNVCLLKPTRIFPKGQENVGRVISKGKNDVGPLFGTIAQLRRRSFIVLTIDAWRGEVGLFRKFCPLKLELTRFVLRTKSIKSKFSNDGLR